MKTVKVICDALGPSPPRAAGGRPGRRAAGFSFIEVMLAITVMAIVATLVIPMMGSTDKTRLRSAARMLIADLEYAQVESMTHSEDLRVLRIDSGTRYSIARQSRPNQPITHPVSGEKYRVEFGTAQASELSGVAISGYALGGDDQIGFGAYGQLDQPIPATITLRSGERTITITLDPDTGEASTGPIL